MTGFHNIVFPTDISYGSKGGPGFNTDVIEIASGYEQRNINWSQARAKYDVAYGVKTGDQLEALIAFFRVNMGRGYWFKYKDWSDYQAVNQICPPSTFQPDPPYNFQCQKVYTSGSQNYTRKIFLLDQSSVLVYIDDVLQDPDTYDVSWGPGWIYFNDPVTGVVTATFDFYVPVRFDIDKLPISLDNYNAAGTYFGGASVPLVEIFPNLYLSWW